eukprot:3325241-Alexandrium_andersonii.AAC.1
MPSRPQAAEHAARKRSVSKCCSARTPQHAGFATDTCTSQLQRAVNTQPKHAPASACPARAFQRTR